MSTKLVEVVPVVLEKHPDPETTALSIVRVGGYVVVARTEDWSTVDRAAYVPIDGVLPERPEYAFLGKHRRIKAKKLRGVFSEGLLVPAPAGASVGDDVTEALGVTFFDPDLMDKNGNTGRVTSGPSEPEPPGPAAPRYTDIENIKGKHAPKFEEGEEIVAVEKIHGCNHRATWRLDAIEDIAEPYTRDAIEHARKRAGRLHVGSHNRWVKMPDVGETRGNTFWDAAHHANLAHTLHAYEGAILYGEAFGPVQDLKYGRDKVDYVAFDLWAPALGRFLDFDDFETIATFFHIPMAPVVYRGPFNMEKLLALAEQDSTVPGASAGHIREGLVIRPVKERSPHGRVIAKLISARYRLRKEA